MTNKWKLTYRYNSPAMGFREALINMVKQLEPDGLAEIALSRADAAVEIQADLIEILFKKGILTSEDLQEILGPSFERAL